jgi:TorA maturation chaperone TorD
MLGDRDLLSFREGYYGLLVALLSREPSPRLLAELAAGIEERARAAQGLHPRLGQGWQTLGLSLATGPPEVLAEAVAEEYTRLFLGPPAPLVNLYESYYLTGRVFERPLAAVREFLAEVGLQRDPGYAEPEDSLAFELEVMRRLAGRQAAAREADEEARWLGVQAGFLRDHLLVWGPAAARDLASAEGAGFYRGVGQILEGFMAFEVSLFSSCAPMPVKSLEEARRTWGGAGQWRGPVMEMPDPDPGPGGAAQPRSCRPGDRPSPQGPFGPDARS